MDAAPVPCLLGPTASGKSDVAVHLARATDGEVISCDAFSVYRGMDILTAAPCPPPDVPHHLTRVRDPSERFDAAAFVEACDRLVPEIRQRGRVPWIVGGTALYLRAWLKGLGARVGRDEALRQRLRLRAQARGTQTLHDDLRERDPARAAEVHPHDLRRIVRALEILHLTGRPASAQRREWAGPDRRAAHLYGLRREDADLQARIDRRAAALVPAGVLDEARSLLARPLSPEAAKVLGLDVLAEVLAGARAEADAVAEIARRTRRFARKQMTFFRSFAGVRWFDVAAEEDPASVAARILDAYQAGGTSA